MEPARIATITPVRNDVDDIAAAVASILGQRGVEIAEVVLAVGPSTDDTLKVAEGLADLHPNVRVVENPSGRTPDGLNLAIDATTADIIVRVDARSFLPEHYIRNAVETLDATGAANVGAVQLPQGHTLVERGIAAAMRSRLGNGGAAYRADPERRRVETAWLGVFRRGPLMSVGGYDTEFTRNQDAELNIRLGKAGHEVWLDPRLVVPYRPRGSISALARQFGQYGWWRARTIRKHPDSARVRQLVPPIAVVVLGGSALLSAASPLFLIVPASYLGAVGLASLGGDEPAAVKAVMAAALVTIHLSWGAGFLAGSLRWWLSTTQRRQP